MKTLTIEIIPEGYVLLARKIRKSPLWKSLKATHKVVMIELILQAQFRDGEVVRNGEIIHLKRGQIATSYQQLVDDIGDKDITVKVVRNAINKLIKHGFLAKDEAKARAKKGLLLTIVNYDTYQTPENYKGKDKDKVTGNEGAKRGQSEGKEGAINNNDNNVFNNDLNNDVATTKESTVEVAKKILDRYMELRGLFFFSPKDEMAAKEISLSGISSKDAIRFLEEKFRIHEKNKKHSRDEINSLSYCVGYILDRYHEKKAGADNVKGVYPYRRSDAGSPGKSSSYEQELRALEVANRAFGR